jgi:MinD-like ATPase involved in chromosome partitioning or flagellar assembly
MAAIGFVSAKGSPGVTTLAVALASVWPQVHAGRRVLVAGCDPAGDDLRGGFLRGAVDGNRGVPGLAASRGQDPVDAVWSQLFTLDDTGNRLLLPGLPDASRAAAVARAWSLLEAALPRVAQQDPPVDVLLDLGRLGTAGAPTGLLGKTDVTVLVTRSSLPAVVAGRAAATALHADAPGPRPVGVVVVNANARYGGREVAAAVALPLLGVVPDDPSTAAVFADGAPAGRRTPRSPLVRAARSIATSLLAFADQHTATALAPVEAPHG